MPLLSVRYGHVGGYFIPLEPSSPAARNRRADSDATTYVRMQGDLQDASVHGQYAKRDPGKDSGFARRSFKAEFPANVQTDVWGSDSGGGRQKEEGPIKSVALSDDTAVHEVAGSGMEDGIMIEESTRRASPVQQDGGGHIQYS